MASGGAPELRALQLTMTVAEAQLLIELLRKGQAAASPAAREAGQHLLAALEAALSEGKAPMA